MPASIIKGKFTKEGLAKICKRLDKSEDFYYSPIEGGYIDHNGEVIFIDNRFPYEGMLLPLKELTEDQKQSWHNYFTKLLKED